MKTSILTRFIVLLLAVLTGLVACQKDKSDSSLTPQEEEQASLASSQSDAESEIIFNEVFDNVIGVNAEVGIGGVGIFGRMNNNALPSESIRVDSARCFTVTTTRLNSPEPFPLRIVTDFGAGCKGKDGRIRYGKIITTYTGKLTKPGKEATTTFDGYRIDSLSIEGTHKVSNTGSLTQRQYTVTVEKSKISKPGGDYSQWNSHRVTTQVEGMATPEKPLDDAFTITGNSSGTVKKGTIVTTWESNITEPLFKRFTCRWITKGQVKTTRKNASNSNASTAVLNYGNGECDHFATLTVNGVTHQIILHK